jgi:2'-5' RNA ligase
MLPGDRVICAFVTQQSVGSIFTDWPLHITIVPWFRLDSTSAQLAEQLKKHYISSNAFTVTVLDEVRFGYKRTKLVNLVGAPELMKLEGQTRRLLHAHKAWIVDEADKTRRGFRPHVTALSTGRVHSGENFMCDRLYIVSQHGNFKRIDSVITL